MTDTTTYATAVRQVDSIQVGSRHRRDLGDIDALAASIHRLGLLQPLTVAPDGVLICGWRRLEAIRKLGWKRVDVWVRSGVTDRLHLLLAERDENGQRKDLSPVEASELYEELLTLEREEAERRQSATRFGSRMPGSSGGALGAPPDDPASAGFGKSRRRAAETVTGRASYNNLEKIAELRHLADDEKLTEGLRQMIRAELRDIDDGMRNARTAYDHVKDQIERLRNSPEPPAAARPRRLQAVPPLPDPPALPDVPTPEPADPAPPAPTTRSTPSFVITWTELAGWTEHYDIDRLAAELSDDAVDAFQRVREETDRFADALIARRRASRPTRSA
ncbi:ParB domain protein nuclease [Xylanimonas cellulosilytica DSM 15894]|uniref:ParB domain protein nuclease n=1 Tax=Xylanimonas cellulosilytica (strain DSM 15894 / JCM 12276 / CECT 5975 / KCTC 9989 / LMG 20990 / NBRC 107835 / XIL07) TaxID=446471 RepID=D1BY18_XYLCX|nr:ParB N-terminal domain-containing protein [Xylanimonas cellulosilytica]ACZ29861.1 ParB domain protein nuclease [Xylanimonas cellulosilytica DSM 15894]